MHRPVLLLIPVAMLLDYALTIVGARLRERAVGQHFQIDHYELNPLFQKTVAKLRWFAPRHLAAVALVTAAMFLLDAPRYPGLWDPVDFMLGALLVTLAIVIGRHVANILGSLYLLRHPQEVSGRMRMTHALVLVNSGANLLGILAPLVVLALLLPASVTYGAVFGVATVLVVNVLWYWLARRKAARLAREAPQRERDAGADEQQVREQVRDES